VATDTQLPGVLAEARRQVLAVAERTAAQSLVVATIGKNSAPWTGTAAKVFRADCARISKALSTQAVQMRALAGQIAASQSEVEGRIRAEKKAAAEVALKKAAEIARR
jgi:hypothetical protein